MATKINETYYGAENTWSAISSTWGSACKRVDNDHTFMKLAKTGVLDLDNESLFDLSCVPWGVPRCSVASCAYPLFLSSGAVSNFLGYFTPENEDLDTKNNALCIVSGGGFSNSSASGQSLSGARLKQKQRIIGKTTYYNNTIASSLSADNNGDLGSDSYYGQGVITYLDYQTTKVIIDTVTFIDKSSTSSSISNNGNLKVIAFKDIPTAIENNVINDNWQVNCFSCRFVVNNNLSSSGTIHPTFANKHKVPLHVKNTYSNNVLTEWVQVQRNVIGQIGRAFGQNTVNAIVKREDVDVLGSSNSYLCSGELTAYANMSEHVQKFDDIEYNWICSTRFATGSAVFWREYGDPIVNASMRYFSLLKTNSESIADVQKAILHEVAFLGFPFIIDDTYVTENIGDEHVYLPVFDDHVMTTGLYKIGSESLSLDNATWNDIFDDGMPEYDPNYQPPEPEPEENDYGDVDNLGSARGVLPSGVNIYLMSRLDYTAFMSELNSYYANSLPDDWTLDFQGVNPSDYVLNVYYTPYNFVKSENKSAVKIGNIELTTTAYELSEGQPGIDDPNKWKYFTYGTRKVTPLYYDFRDYDPYTKVELYLPLAGTIELDTNYVMNHNITVEYYFDLMTMSGVAAVYRDNMLYKTSDFKLGAQVPLLTTNMGQIQNQITQLEFSQKQNNLRLATSAISSGVSIASIVAGGEATTAQAVGAGGGAFSLASGIMKADEIDYQLKHTTPSVSVTGAAEPLNNYSVGQLTPKLIIKRPLMLNTLDNAIYSKTIGNSCCINTTLNSMNGLVVCSAIDTTGIKKEINTGIYISPTIDEINMIKSTFNSGVIL